MLAALETCGTPPAARNMNKLNSITSKNQSSCWLVAEAEEKRILKLHLALLVLIIIYLRVVVRVPMLC